jgi:hypothetical protein
MVARVSVPNEPVFTSSESPGKKSSDQRKELLGRAIAAQLAQGSRRVETQSDFSAVVVVGKPVNHVLHLILTLVTFFMWGLVWILMAITGGEKREMISVDEYGNTSIQRL